MLRLPESQMESERRVWVLRLPEPGIITVQPEHQTWSLVTSNMPLYCYCCENMAQSCCMKYHKVHIDQASLWPATWGSSLVIAIKCDTSESGFEMLRLPEQGLITTQNINPFRILPNTCTSLHYWCGNFAHDVHFLDIIWGQVLSKNLHIGSL